MIGNSPLFSMLTTKMDYLVQRQRVLAENVANADTPNYAARDLKPLDFDAVLRGQAGALGLARTHQSHQTAPGGDERFRANGSDTVYEVAPSGNAVVLEEQLMKVDVTRADYQLATNLFRKYQSLYRMALGGGGGGGAR